MKRVSEGKYHKLHKKERVRLKPDRADVYRLAHGGSEGWIGDLALDPVGNYPMVYIKWDKDHWLYNGEPDLWTFEDHFEPVKKEETMSDEKKQPSMAELAQEFAKFIAAREGESAESVEKEPAEEEAVEEAHAHELGLRLSKSQDEFIETLTKASEAASEAEAFLMLTIKPAELDPERKIKVLVPDLYIQFQNEAAGYSLQLAIADILNQFFSDAVLRVIHENKIGNQPEV